MTQWIEAQDVAGLLRPGMTVFIAGGTAEPREMLKALSENGESCAGVRFIAISLPGINTLDFTSLHGKARSTAFFATAQNRESIAAGNTEFIPMQYRAIFDYLERELPVDMAWRNYPGREPTVSARGSAWIFCPRSWPGRVWSSAKSTDASPNRRTPPKFPCPAWITQSPATGRCPPLPR